MVTQYLRRIEKRSSIAGQVPTIPLSNDHTDGTWLVTDIYEGELFINLADKKVYTRCGGIIVQLNIDDATLAYILANIHVPNTDFYLDFGGTNQVSASDIKLKLHTQNTDTILDDGGVNEVSASEIRAFINSKGQPLGIVPLNSSGIIDDKYLSIQSLAKGTISVNTDFPLLAVVQKYWWYQVTATVTDNVHLHTNTGLTFSAGDEIYWDGTTWQPYGNLQTSDRQPQIVVKTETQLINAYNTLKTTGGGTIVFGADITLTASRSFDNSGIKVVGGGYTLLFSGYTITITNRSCYFENILLQGNGSSTISLFNFNNTTYGTSQFVFTNCRFHNCVESNYNTIGVLDSSGLVGSFHVVFNQCSITSINTINTNYLSIKLYGNSSSSASITVLGCKSAQTTTETNYFGWIGSLYDSGCRFNTDGSGIYNGLSLSGINKNYCIIDSPFFSTRDAITSRDNSDYLTVLDSTDNKIKKILVSDFIIGIGGSATLAALSDVNVTGVLDRDYLIYDSTTSKYVPFNPHKITKEFTGFRYPDLVNVSYNSTNRTFTLTGTVECYYQGKLLSAITSGWTSTAHAAVNGTYYLRYNGTAFVFDTTAWDFSDLQIGQAQYQSAYKIGMRDPHGFMQREVHDELHNTIGTYLSSGGDLSSYVLSSITAADRRPDIAQTIVKDEDLPSTLPALTSKVYTQRYLSGTNTKNYTVGASDIIALSGSQPYYNQWNGSAWVQTLFSNNNYGAIFIMAVPVTSDSESQGYRYLFIQPQTVSSTLADIQALTPNSVNLGDSTAVLNEYVYIGKIIIRYTSSNWTLISAEKLSGTRISQSSTPSNALSSVATDSSLSGNGTPASPLSTNFWRDVAGTPTRVSNTQFTITDTSNTLGLQNVYSKGTVLKWIDSSVTKIAMVTSASYATNAVTVNILGDVLNAGFTSMKYCNVKATELQFAYNGLLSIIATDICRAFYSGQAMKYFCVEANCTAGSGGSGSTTIALKSAGVTISTLSFANTDTNKLVPVTDLATVAANSKITWDITAVLTSPTTFHSDLSAIIYAFPLNTIYLA